MIDIPSKTTIPGQDSIASIREGLTNFTRIIARQRGADALLAELSQHVVALQDLLAHLEQELEAQASERGELDALYEIGQAIGSSLDLTEVLNQVMDQIIRLTGAERSFLMLVDPDTGELEFRAARNMDRVRDQPQHRQRGRHYQSARRHDQRADGPAVQSAGERHRV
jgi:nitrate/nitrite-specific signal transduction histidine kinase